jgi:hypothetical protein
MLRECETSTDEIKITPEMIEAGVAALCRNYGFMPDDVTVFGIFNAMISVSPLKRCRVVERE